VAKKLNALSYELRQNPFGNLDGYKIGTHRRQLFPGHWNPHRGFNRPGKPCANFTGPMARATDATGRTCRQ
jgi:hypothetical protein